MKKTLLAVIFSALFFASCSQQPKTVSGVIVDATMNGITILTQQGDTLAFATEGAQIDSPNGILLSDTAIVTYQGKLNETLQGEITPALTVIVKSAPKPAPSIIGSWVQPIPGIGGVQGVEIKADGLASSINMATLLYSSWVEQADSLRLSGQSVGNGQTIDFTNSYKIDKLTSDSLVISKDGFVDRYSRQAN